MTRGTIGANSVIAPSVKLADDVTIGNNVTIEGDVTIGPGTAIGHGVIISGRVTIGARNRFHPYCVIGEPPMFPEKPDSSGAVTIGDGNVFREYVSINAPALTEATCIGNECYLMGYVHVSHDCRLGDHVKMAMHAALAGCVTIGPQAMIGMGNPILKNVPPYAVVHSGQFVRVNRYGLEKRGFAAADIDAIERYYQDGGPPPAIARDDLAAFAARAKEKTFVFAPNATT